MDLLRPLAPLMLHPRRMTVLMIGHSVFFAAAVPSTAPPSSGLWPSSTHAAVVQLQQMIMPSPRMGTQPLSLLVHHHSRKRGDSFLVNASMKKKPARRRCRRSVRRNRRLTCRLERLTMTTERVSSRRSAVSVRTTAMIWQQRQSKRQRQLRCQRQLKLRQQLQCQ